MLQEYVSLSDAVSPTAAAHHQNTLQFPHYNDDVGSEGDEHLPQQPLTWWERLTQRRHPPPAPQQSGYLTLIPLSDSRLKPRRTKLIVSTLLAITVASVCGVFFTVSRGVTVGTIQVHSSEISFNTSKSTYQILLTATIPIYNPNYWQVKVSGTVNVSFYDQQAGFTLIKPVYIPARAQPEIISVPMDASSVPQKYLFTIYTQCFTFPEKLIFFLTGNLQAEYLGKSYTLPNIDNYFIIACNQASSKKGKTRPPALPLQLPTWQALEQGPAAGEQQPERELEQKSINDQQGESDSGIVL